MLREEKINEIVNDETKSFLRAIYKETKETIKRSLQHALTVSHYQMFKTIRDKDYYFPRYKERLREFLATDAWIVYLFQGSPIFRFLVFLGFPEEELLDTFIFVANLSKEKKKEFFTLLFYEIWRNLKKEEDLLSYLMKKYESLRKRQGKL